MSSDLRRHAIGFLTAGLFEQHDRSRFEVTAISLGPDGDSELRRRLVAAFDRFLDVRNMGDHEAARLMRDIEIDIAVDLNGHTALNRPGILAHRPAPLQVNYLGYPGTMGADFIDYIMADRIVIPRNERAFYSEKVIELPDCYQVNDRKRPIADAAPRRAEAGLPDEGFVFCSFNNNVKITPDVFDVWMRLLRQIEGSVLWLFEGHPAAPANLRREAAQRGIAGERIIFAPRAELSEHLARHRLADLFLDTLPYNAHVTASDALWGGLPVLTCQGMTFAGRVAASLLHAVGLPELVTDSLAQYEDLALALARDPARLGTLRTRLASNRLTFPLFDTARTTRQIEAAYRTIWERHARGERPASFAVDPAA